MNKNTSGFTIVELLIVIVVIAILAAVSIVAYTNIQQRARDTQRIQDVATIVKALELHYAVVGSYPAGEGATTPNASWSTTADASWELLLAKLAPYASGMPTRDPLNQLNTGNAASSFTYSYYSNGAGSAYCGASGVRQMFILTYRLESGHIKQETSGECASDPLGYSQSWTRVVR